LQGTYYPLWGSAIRRRFSKFDGSKFSQTRRCFGVVGYLHDLLAMLLRARGLSLRPGGDVVSWLWAFARPYWRRCFTVVSFPSDLVATSLWACWLSARAISATSSRYPA